MVELGGKNPCIVDIHSDFKLTAKRIVWGKFLNAGQTCIAPDYLIVQAQAKFDFTKALIAEIEHDGKSIPVLLRHYLKLNAQLLSFNVDKSIFGVEKGPDGPDDIKENMVFYMNFLLVLVLENISVDSKTPEIDSIQSINH